MNGGPEIFRRLSPKWVLGCVATITVAILLAICIFVFASGLGTFRQVSISEFFFGADWNANAFATPSWGILSLILSSAMISVLAILIVVPIGLSIAIYLSQIASPKVREFLKPLVEMIASIPSVVLGLLGLLFLAPLIAKAFHLSNGLNGVTASILVAIATLPTVASISEDALSSVSQKFKEASLALGATQWTTIKRIVIPTAKSGLVAAIMLGLGRIIGETMIVLMVAGNSRALPRSLLDPLRPLTANIAIEIKEAVVGSLHWQALFMTGFVLFVITFVVNFMADLFIHKKQI